MSILKFKQFESIQDDFDFPSFEDVAEYFYDFSDEIGLLVNCSDEEYIKICETTEHYKGNKNLTKHFI